MFRHAFLASAASLFIAGYAPTAAMGAPATVETRISPELAKLADETYGQAEINALAAQLKRKVERATAHAPGLEDARISLILTDARPNRPTVKQLADKPGLSFHSFGVGGAAIEARITRSDGSTSEVAYRMPYSWYENDVRQAVGRSTWQDAELAISQFARLLER